MGTWDDGLYDNDHALDCLATLTKIDVDADALALVAQIGLSAWFDPSGIQCGVERLRSAVAAHAAAIAGLPDDTRASLEVLLAAPEESTRDRSRTPAVHEVLGSYCDGPQLDALLRFPGAQPAVEAFAEAAARTLDGALAASSRDLVELSAPLAALGIVLQLAQSDLWRPAPPRVAAWRAGFEAADLRTTEERGFWNSYARRVRLGFELLTAA